MLCLAIDRGTAPPTAGGGQKGPMRLIGCPRTRSIKAEEVRLQAMENGQLSAAIAAIKEIGVLTGLRIERRERGGPGEFAEVSTEQLVSELRDLGIEVKFH